MSQSPVERPGPPDRLARVLSDRRIWGTVALVVSVIVIGAQAEKAYRWHRRQEPGFNEDIKKRIWSSKECWEGRDPYSGAPEFLARINANPDNMMDIDRGKWNTSPPAMLWLMTPVCEVDEESAAICWTAVNCLLLPAAIWFACAAAAPDRPWLPALLIPVSAMFWPVRFNLFVGNFELLLLFLTAVAAWLLSRGSCIAAGAVLGLAIAVKIHPAFLAAGLWLGGRRRAAVAAGVVGGGLLAGGLWWAGWNSLAGFEAAVAVKLDTGSAICGWPWTESMNAFLCRLWVPHNGNFVFPAVADHSGWVKPAVGLWTVALLAAWFAVEYPRRSRWTMLSLAFSAAAVPLLTPTSEAYSFVALMFPLAVVVGRAPELVMARRWGLIAGFAASIFLAGLRPGDHWKEVQIEEMILGSTLLTNLWLTKVWLGGIGFWVCLLVLRLDELPPRIEVRPKAAELPSRPLQVPAAPASTMAG